MEGFVMPQWYLLLGLFCNKPIYMYNCFVAHRTYARFYNTSQVCERLLYLSAHNVLNILYRELTRSGDLATPSRYVRKHYTLSTHNTCVRYRDVQSRKSAINTNRLVVIVAIVSCSYVYIFCS